MRIVACALAAAALWAQSGLTPQQTAILRTVDAEAEAGIALLERITNVNSGTFNPAGVSKVAEMLEPEFKALGFTTRLLPMDAAKRGPHLVAERKGNRGKRLLLIGHTDTVFEPTSPFQKFVRNGASATGPGVSDMKGGIVVMLSALKALHKEGVLDGSTVTVFLTGDEENPGDHSITRKDFVSAAKNSDIALCFEGGARREGKDFVSTARRGATSWRLKVRANTGHSSGIFSERMGSGAIYEISRILSQFHDTLREPSLSYSVGMVLGGSDIKVDDGGQGSVTGKSNIVPGEALAIGDIRAISMEQLARLKDKMHSVVAKNLSGTKAEITFEDHYPPMAETPGNIAVYEELKAANRLLGLPEVEILDPLLRGAGDISFVSPYLDALSGLGANGSGAHAPGERVELDRLPIQSKRAALLIQRLIEKR